MAFAAAGFFEHLLGGPAQVAEVVGQQDAGEEGGGAGAAAHAEGDLVVELEMERCGEAGCGGEHVAVGVEDQVVVECGRRGRRCGRWPRCGRLSAMRWRRW